MRCVWGHAQVPQHMRGDQRPTVGQFPTLVEAGSSLLDTSLVGLWAPRDLCLLLALPGGGQGLQVHVAASCYLFLCWFLPKTGLLVIRTRVFTFSRQVL